MQIAQVTPFWLSCSQAPFPLVLTPDALSWFEFRPPGTVSSALSPSPFPLCLPAKGGVRFLQTLHHSGPVTLHSTMVRLHQLQQ